MPAEQLTTPASRFWKATPGVLALLFALTAPWSIAAAETTVVAGALFLTLALLARKIRLPRIPWTFYLILAYFGAQALSIPTSVDPARSLVCYKGAWVNLFPLVFWSWLDDERVRRRTIAFLVGSAAVVGLYGVGQHFAGWDVVRHRPLENYGGGGYVATGAFGGHLTFAGVLIPIFFLAIGLAFGTRHRRRWLAAALVIGLALLFSFARTAWIGVAAGLLALALWRGRRAFLFTVVLLAVVAAGASWVEPAIRLRILSIFGIGDDPRARLWRTALRIFAHYPITGAGLGAFPVLFEKFKVPGFYMWTGHPHSDFLNVLEETGVIGGLCWLGIWVAFFLETRPRPGPGRPAPWLLDGMRAAIVGLLVGGIGQCFITDELVAEVWWFVVAAGILESRQMGARAGGAAEG